MSTALRLTIVALGSTLAAVGLACGVCIEDKIAATYDYAIVMGATAKHHVVVFGQIDGAVDMQAVNEKITATAPRVRGVDRGTVRTSTSLAAFSFALDPAAQAPDAAVAELQKRLRVQGLKLSVLRIVSSDSLLPASRKGAAN